MAGAGDFHLWLGLNPIQPRTNRVAVPEQATAIDLVEPGDSLYWGCKNKNRIVVSRFKQPFDTDPDLTRFTATTVQPNRVATIPKFFFDDYDGRANYSQPVHDRLRLDYGETLHFITSATLYRDGLCYVLDDEAGRTVIHDYLDSKVPVEAETTEHFVPEADFADTILLLDKRRGLSPDELKQLLLPSPEDTDDVTVPYDHGSPASGQSNDDERPS